MGTVVSIVYTPRDQAGRPQGHYVRIPLESARLIEGRGIENDAKGRHGDRQINVMCVEVLDNLAAEGFKTGPGEMGEQIVIGGIEPRLLEPGTRWRVGEAILEVTIPRTGCARFETIQNRSRQSVVGRLGVLTKVILGGFVQIGDQVRLESEQVSS